MVRVYKVWSSDFFKEREAWNTTVQAFYLWLDPTLPTSGIDTVTPFILLSWRIWDTAVHIFCLVISPKALFGPVMEQ